MTATNFYHAYHTTVTRTFIAVLFLLGSAGILVTWGLRRILWVVIVATDWLDERLIDVEESLYEHAWVARSKLPPWKDP